MSTTIASSIGNTGAAGDSSSVAQAVDRIFKKVDSNRDDKITKSELTQALESDSVEIGAGGQEPNVDDIFKLLDSGNKGYITRQDAADGLDTVPLTPTADAKPEASGPPEGGSRRPGGGGGGGGGGASASEDYDPADTNQDGAVSMQEEIAYILKQYAKTDSPQQSESVTYG